MQKMLFLLSFILVGCEAVVVTPPAEKAKPSAPATEEPVAAAIPADSGVSTTPDPEPEPEITVMADPILGTYRWRGYYCNGNFTSSAPAVHDYEFLADGKMNIWSSTTICGKVILQQYDFSNTDWTFTVKRLRSWQPGPGNSCPGVWAESPSSPAITWTYQTVGTVISATPQGTSQCQDGSPILHVYDKI